MHKPLFRIFGRRIMKASRNVEGMIFCPPCEAGRARKDEHRFTKECSSYS